uniref:Uncharacterized protein n=1 Tax=Timema tahoe TaxID=61484 RepID=A0A7R9FKX5_9NEOP|nr:unnamed protein product [Timema tahoe]
MRSAHSSSFYGKVPPLSDTKLHGILKFINISLSNALIAALVEAFLTRTSHTDFEKASNTVNRSYKNKTGKMRTFWEANRPLVPVLLFLLLSTVWVTCSPVDIIELDPRFIYLTTGTIFSNICCRLIVSQMSSTRCEIFNWMFLPTGLVVALSLLLPDTPTNKTLNLCMLYILSLLAIVSHIHYGTCVVSSSD